MVTAVLHGCEGWQGAPESQNPAEINQRERELQAGYTTSVGSD